jgi:two-component system sensor histidine kinase BaeS
MSRPRLSLMGRLAVTMGTITIAAVALSMTLVSHSLDGRLNRLGVAHVQSSANRVALLAAARYRPGGWSSRSLAELVERSHIAGFDITVTDPAGRPLTANVRPNTPRHRWTAAAPVVVAGRTVGELELRPTRTDIFGSENRALRHQLNGLLAVCAGLALGLALFAASMIAATLVRPLRRLTETAERMRRGDLSARARIHGGAELEHLADAFNELASQLAREDESRRAAAADIAHELRTPVAGIVSRIEAAQDGVMNDGVANLEAMHAEALRLAHLIDDVGKLAEAERPDLLISHAELDLADTCALRAAAYEGFFAAKDIAFETRIEATPVHGDARRLEQVVDNLLSNALRYTDPGGTVELHVSRGIAGCVVEVRDTGMGIAAEDMPHVFDRFWRSDRSRSRATGGSGIGLAVVRELVRAHKGRVELRSELGRGTVARVVLPAGVPAAAPLVRPGPARVIAAATRA